jgi:hypothetical protein
MARTRQKQRSGFPLFLAIAALVAYVAWRGRRSPALAPGAPAADAPRFSGDTREAGIGPEQSTPLTEDEQARMAPHDRVPSLDALDIDAGPTPEVGATEAPDSGETGLDVAEQTETPAAAPGTPDPTAEGMDLAGAGDDESAEGAYVPDAGATSCPIIYPIKGNRRSHIYHEPSDPEYATLHPGICFATTRHAESAGYRARKG